METRVVMSRRLALFAVAVAAAVLPPRPVLGAVATAAAADDASPGCTRQCGNISIPHPFGVEHGCFLPGLNVTCRNGTELFLGDGTVQVLEISIQNATVRINASSAYFPGSNNSHSKPSGTWSGALGDGGAYTLAWGRNILLAFGCNVQVFLVGDRSRTLSTCAALCDWDEHENTWFFRSPELLFSGIGSCQASILTARSSYGINALWLNGSTGPSHMSETDIWIVDSEFLSSFVDYGTYLTTSLPAVLDWRINHTICHDNASSAACRSSHSSCKNATDSGPVAHVCNCAQGYQGNPYVPDGCRDINECDDPETYPCHGNCKNTEGGYECHCLPGFTGNASIPNGCKGMKVAKLAC
ncbi:hypothetical protein BAE44_0000107 [Dichanthelium oligosanthes]|uniref:EGF-like domain-containing protein n=1 Tax=Dichanthelium oligosanthes TaxID=888268 RepID=A0A1E5WN95_9POAL|nr:hypothetical protein BAE44_0000107 [Dichanthelium oligosanthes]